MQTHIKYTFPDNGNPIFFSCMKVKRKLIVLPLLGGTLADSAWSWMWVWLHVTYMYSQLCLSRIRLSRIIA